MDKNTELTHHGILGQKWGVRRYQNPDGSLKPAGEKHYYGLDSLSAKKREAQHKAIDKNTRAAEKLDKKVEKLQAKNKKRLEAVETKFDKKISKSLDASNKDNPIYRYGKAMDKKVKLEGKIANYYNKNLPVRLFLAKRNVHNLAKLSRLEKRIEKQFSDTKLDELDKKFQAAGDRYANRLNKPFVKNNLQRQETISYKAVRNYNKSSDTDYMRKKLREGRTGSDKVYDVYKKKTYS